MILKKRQILSGIMQAVLGTAPPRFLFQDKFNTNRAAGAVDLTAAEPGIGTRHVTDPGGTRISIASQALLLSNPPSNWIDNQEWVVNGFAWVPGRSYMAKFVRSAASGEFALGLSSSGSSINLYSEVATLHGNVANLHTWGDPSGGTNRIVGTYTGGLTYRSVEVLHPFGVFNFIKGGTEYPEWNLLWIKSSGSSGLVYPAVSFLGATGTVTVDDERLFDCPLPSPFAYDSYDRANGALENTEGIGPHGQGAPTKTYRYTPVSLSLDGVGDFANCGSDSSLDDLINGGSFTVEAWYRCSDITTGGGTERQIIAKTNGSTMGWSIYIGSASSLRIDMNGWVGIPTSLKVAMKDNGIWHHVVGYLDAGKTVRLAVDGVWQTTSAVGGAYTSDATINLIIGAQQSGGGQSMLGNIGWARISRGDRYGGAAGTTFTPPGLDQPPAIDSNTIEQWNMNDGAGSTVVASVKPSTNNGAITGAGWAARPFAISGNVAINNTPNLGQDVVKDGDFSSGSSYNLGTGWAVAAGVATCSSGSGSDISALVGPLMTDTFYRSRYTISGYVSGALQTIAGTTIGTGRSGNGTWNDMILANGAGVALRSNALSGFVGSVDNFSMVPVPLADLLATFKCPHQDVMIDVDHNVATLARRLTGVVLCVDNPSLPNNLVMAVSIREGPGGLAVMKLVNGVWTNFGTFVTAWAANAKVRMIKKGTTFTVFYAGLAVTTQTISDASIISNRYHGIVIIDHDGTSQANNLGVWARGAGGEYSYFDRYANA